MFLDSLIWWLGSIVLTSFLLITAYFLIRRLVLEQFWIPSTGKYTLITGCDSGFGRLLAIRLLKERRVNVFAACFTDKGVQSLIDEWELMEGAKGHLYTLKLDITNDESVKSAREYVENILQQKNGKLWSLINNAGLFSIHGPDDWVGTNEFSHAIDVNFLGAVRMCHAFGPLLKKSKGRIVTMGSTAGRLHGLFVGSYAASKAAVGKYMDCLRFEMSQYNVSVHILEPGCFKTELLNQEAQKNRIDKIWDSLDEDVRNEYGEDYKQKFVVAWGMGVNWAANTNLNWVVDCYIHAQFSWYPRLRYAPGWDAIFVFIPLSLVPTFVGDWMLNILYLLHPGPTLIPAALQQEKRKSKAKLIMTIGSFLAQLSMIPLIYTAFFAKESMHQKSVTVPQNHTTKEPANPF